MADFGFPGKISDTPSIFDDLPQNEQNMSFGTNDGDPFDLDFFSPATDNASSTLWGNFSGMEFLPSITETNESEECSDFNSERIEEVAGMLGVAQDPPIANTFCFRFDTPSSKQESDDSSLFPL
jgi:hypothetical protein